MSTVWFYCQGFWVFLSILNLNRYWHIITSDIRNLCSKIKPWKDPDFWIWFLMWLLFHQIWALVELMLCWILLFPTDPTWLIEGICYKTSQDDFFISIIGNLELFDFYTLLRAKRFESTKIPFLINICNRGKEKTNFEDFLQILRKFASGIFD